MWISSTLYLQGCTEFHSDIYELIIRFYKLKNVPLQKCVATLWECRRLNHALCVSPINEAFITKLSEHCGENSKLIDFWVQCLGSSKPLLIGLKQNLSFFFYNFTHASNNPRRDIHSGASIKDVKEVVSELISNVSPVFLLNSFCSCWFETGYWCLPVVLIGSCSQSFCFPSWLSLPWLVWKTNCQWKIIWGKLHIIC